MRFEVPGLISLTMALLVYFIGITYLSEIPVIDQILAMSFNSSELQQKQISLQLASLNEDQTLKLAILSHRLYIAFALIPGYTSDNAHQIHLAALKQLCGASISSQVIRELNQLENEAPLDEGDACMVEEIKLQARSQRN